VTDQLRRQSCLDANLLAEYVDGGLDPRTRADVEAHLAECGECYEVFAEAVRMQGAHETAPVATAAPMWRRRSVMAAAAAVLLIVAASAEWARRSGQAPSDPGAEALAVLVSISHDRRFTVGRLTGFAWAAPPVATRSTLQERPPLVQQQAAIALQLLAEQERSVTSLHGAGIGHLVMGDLDAAVQSLTAAVAAGPDDVLIQNDLATALLERWRLTNRMGDLSLALETLEQARERSSPPPLLFNRALVLEYLGMTSLAVEAWRDFLSAEPGGQWADEARVHVERLSRQSRREAPPRGLTVEVAQAVVASEPWRAYAALDDDLLPEWIDALERGVWPTDSVTVTATRLAEALNGAQRDSHLLATIQALDRSREWSAARRTALAATLKATGEWYRRIDDGDYPAAARLADRALMSATEAGVDDLEAAVARAYSDLTDNRDTRYTRELERRTETARQRGHFRLAARGERMLAVSTLGRGDLAGGERHFALGEEDADRSGDADLRALFLTFRAELVSIQGDEETAWRKLTGALTLLPLFRTRRQAYDTLGAATWLARKNGMPRQAKVFAAELQSTTETWPNPEGRVTALLELARAERDLGQPELARQHVSAAAEQLPALAARSSAQERLSVEVDAIRAAVLGADQATEAIESASRAIAFFSRAFTIRLAELLLLRGQLHNGHGQRAFAIADWERGAAVIEDQRASIRSEQLRMSRTASMWDIYAELIRAHKTSPKESLRVSERARARELLYSLAPTQSVGSVSLADTQRVLGPDAIAVVYRQLPESLLVWVVSGTDVLLHELPFRAAEVTRMSDAFLDDIRQGRSQPGRLVTAVVPKAAWQGTGPLVVVADGALARIPFAALSQTGTGRFLVDRRPVIVAPSLAAFTLATTAARTTRPRAVVAIGVSDAVPSLGLAFLPGVRREVHAVARPYGANAVVLLDGEASSAKVRASWRQAGVIHIGAHASADTTQPDRSRLFLGQGTTLVPSEISASPGLTGAVVVLSACSAAAGTAMDGEGVISLSRAFFAAGARSVVAPLWDVNDDDAEALMVQLHQRLAAGESAPLALAAVQREQIRQGRPTAAWAGFTAIGGTSHHSNN